MSTCSCLATPTQSTCWVDSCFGLSYCFELRNKCA